MVQSTDLTIGIYAKIERAKEHATDLAEHIERFFQRELYRVLAENDPDTGDRAFRVQVIEQPLRWAAMIGDTIHNLRSALDLLARRLVLANGGRLRPLKMPGSTAAKLCGQAVSHRLGQHA